jgi:hypothetical protein
MPTVGRKEARKPGNPQMRSPLADHHDEVVRLAAEQVSAREIGERCGGVTKCAVIAYCYRRGIKLRQITKKQEEANTARRGKPAPERKLKRWDRIMKFKATPLPPEPKLEVWPPPIGGDGVHILDAGRFQCKRPLWPRTEKTGNVCGRPVKSEWLSFCSGCLSRLLTAHGFDTYRKNLRKQLDRKRSAG